MKPYNSPAKYASISAMLSDKASEPFWGKALSALADFKISSSIALALVLFFAVSVGAVTLTAYTEMTQSGLVYESTGQSIHGQVLGYTSYGYNQPQPTCNRGNCLNYIIKDYKDKGWRAQINYQLQPNITGVIKVNGWPFMNNITGAGEGLTGYDLEPGVKYGFVLYKKSGRKLVKLTTLNIIAPSKPNQELNCSRNVRPGCYLDYAQEDECGVEVCEQQLVCDYAAPPANCSYVPGLNYNPATQCGLELRCNNPTPSYGYMGHLTFKENLNSPMTNPVVAGSEMATLLKLDVISEQIMDVPSFSNQINSLTFEAQPNEALQNIEQAYLYNGSTLLAQAKSIGRIYCTMGSSCPSSTEIVFDLNSPLIINMGSKVQLTIKGDVANSASGSLVLRPVTYRIVPGTIYPTGSNGLKSWWSQNISFSHSTLPVCPTIDIMCRTGETVVWDQPRENSCRLPRCVPMTEPTKLVFIAPVHNAVLALESNQVITWEASENVARVSLHVEAQFMPGCPLNMSCTQVLPHYEIVKFQNNPGKYNWQVGQYLGGSGIPAGEYKLLIEGYNVNGEYLGFDSRNFVIGPVVPFVSSLVSISNMRLPYTDLVKGQTYRFKWDSSGIEKVYIWLYKKSSGNSVVHWISDVVNNNNYFDWTVPTNLADGNDYYARVTGKSSGDLGSSDSQVFTIKSGSVACPLPPLVACRENQTIVWREENGCRIMSSCRDLPPPYTPAPNTGLTNNLSNVTSTRVPTYRYIKIETPSSNSWVAWRELEVYDASGQKILVKGALTTTEYKDSVASRAYDGNANTVWNSGAYNNAGITLDLGGDKAISKIRLLPANFPNPASTTHYIRGKLASDTSFKDINNFSGLIKDNEWLEYLVK